MNLIKRIAKVSTLLILVSSGFATLTYAASSEISHAYSYTGNLQTGDIVSLEPKSNKVEATNQNNAANMFGVVTSNQNSLVTINESSNTVQVVTSGQAQVLVSDLNGNIAVGNDVSSSPIDGVGMKAAEGDRVIGVAQSTFSSSTPGSITQQVKSKTGTSTNVHFGYVTINIVPGQDGASGSGPTLDKLQEIIKSITGRVISPVRILISLFIFFVALVALITLIYASIYATIISIGRNPMAKPLIFRSLTEVIIMVLFIALISAAAIILLLT